MNSSPRAEYVLDQYEALRRHALEAVPLARCGPGLSLFLARGMTSWLEAVTALAPEPARPWPQHPMSARLPVPPAAVRADVTVLLANMVLACGAEETR